MATSIEFIHYVCEQLSGIGIVSYKRMFGEYMVYLNGKPVVIVCDDTAFVKKLPCIEKDMAESEVGFPYKGAKEHYILDIDDSCFSKEIVLKIEEVTSLPKKKSKNR